MVKSNYVDTVKRNRKNEFCLHCCLPIIYWHFRRCILKPISGIDTKCNQVVKNFTKFSQNFHKNDLTNPKFCDIIYIEG